MNNHFVVQPIVLGEGRRLLEGISLQERLQLKLVESKIFKSGCVALRYLKQCQKKISQNSRRSASIILISFMHPTF
jgi:hypothetical protein